MAHFFCSQIFTRRDAPPTAYNPIKLPHNTQGSVNRFARLLQHFTPALRHRGPSLIATGSGDIKVSSIPSSNRFDYKLMVMSLLLNASEQIGDVP